MVGQRLLLEKEGSKHWNREQILSGLLRSSEPIPETKSFSLKKELLCRQKIIEKIYDPII